MLLGDGNKMGFTKALRRSLEEQWYWKTMWQSVLNVSYRKITVDITDMGRHLCF